LYIAGYFFSNRTATAPATNDTSRSSPMCAGPTTNLLILSFSFHPHTAHGKERRHPAWRAPDGGRQRRWRGSPTRCVFLLPSSPLSCLGCAAAFVPHDGDLSGGGYPAPITPATPATPAPAMTRRRPQRRKLPLPHHTSGPYPPPRDGKTTTSGAEPPPHTHTPRRRYRRHSSDSGTSNPSVCHHFSLWFLYSRIQI
jgi:hypothetical protein